MSVATRNPFAILNDDDVGESAPVPVKAPAPPAPAPQSAPKEQKARSGPASKGGRYYQRGGGTKTAPRDSQDNDADATPRENRKSDGEVRGRGRGGGRGGRGRGVPGRGRQYDRHSGTLPDSDKKVNQGWGANEGNAELNAEQQGDADAAKDASGENWGVDTTAAVDNAWGATAPAAEGDAWGGAGTGGDNAESKDAAQAATPGNEARPSTFPTDEEDNSLTLDEYLAQKAKSDGVTVPKIEAIRKANEGVDESVWKDTVLLDKAKEEDNYFVGKSVKSTPKARAKKEEKVHIEIDARFERPLRGNARGGRGGRGRGGDKGFRGGGGRGGPRQVAPAPRNASPRDVDVDDQAAFPSLA